MTILYFIALITPNVTKQTNFKKVIGLFFLVSWKNGKCIKNRTVNES